MVAHRLLQLLVGAVSLVSVQASLVNKDTFVRRADGSDGISSDALSSGSGTEPTSVLSVVDSVAVSTTNAISLESTAAAPSETVLSTTSTRQAASTSTNIVISTTAIPPTSVAVASSSDVPPSTTAAPSTAETGTPSSAEGPNPTTSEDDNDGSSTTTAADQSTTEAPESSSEPTRIITTQVTVITRTNSDGSKSVMTTSQVTTSVPGLNTDDGTDENTGISAHTRNTIIGVVVGVGGAIILGALALVAWRIWGRKRHTDEDEAFISYDHNEGYTGIEKSEPGSSASNTQQNPFQSTLENYHQPSSAASVNPSANF